MFQITSKAYHLNFRNLKKINKLSHGEYVRKMVNYLKVNKE